MEDYHFPSSWGAAGYAEAGLPGHHTVPVPRNPSPPPPRIRRPSRGDADAGEVHHYLDSFFWCGRHLGGNKDIYMYRGDTPFCSDECRQQQIEADEARERRFRQRQRLPAATARTKREREREREPERQSRSPQRIPLWAR